ncbi:MAG: hypothetical protein QOH91_2230 [Mycobacterium sp.]|nr:hypothetical protein [Mycobacterium sp.]
MPSFGLVRVLRLDLLGSGQHRSWRRDTPRPAAAAAGLRSARLQTFRPTRVWCTPNSAVAVAPVAVSSARLDHSSRRSSLSTNTRVPVSRRTAHLRAGSAMWLPQISTTHPAVPAETVNYAPSGFIVRARVRPRAHVHNHVCSAVSIGHLTSVFISSSTPAITRNTVVVKGFGPGVVPSFGPTCRRSPASPSLRPVHGHGVVDGLVGQRLTTAHAPVKTASMGDCDARSRKVSPILADTHSSRLKVPRRIPDRPRPKART